jgi:antitoxin MazE
MLKNLVKHGNSWALVIDRPILELLNIRPEDPVEITTDGKSMTIAPASPAGRQAHVRATRKKVNARHKEAFKRLAE